MIEYTGLTKDFRQGVIEGGKSLFHAVLIAGGVALAVGRGKWQKWREFFTYFLLLGLV
ncbi:hypothetical protein [Mesobacillus selenatarsenatis]|uniref:Uncharacterized protein n=1 Tax=Mesobacillus selenatarsenatis (strain DSM 18680 / JCM 14380 / FERM P-15431 / SF-1) TaxID=1321606 RepID=A0A0A8X755_MESS1|nr:hypothetical protein [Mesobacillus selenatarsenatis]GAM13946.1 hypothetical protein SAMD00020551_2093 [Mesobacillus selenatarsenatis SF-1]